MSRHFVGLVLSLALSAMGCGETSGAGGSGGHGGEGGSGGSEVACIDSVCPCTEAGIRAAIAEGGEEPFTFACDGQTTVVTDAEIIIESDVILDGEGNLTLDGNNDHRLLSVAPGLDAELIGLSLTKGKSVNAGALSNEGTLALTGVAVSDNACWGRDCFAGGIDNFGTLTLTNSTVSGNTGSFGAGIFSAGELRIANSTVSGNTNGGGSRSLAIINGGTTALIQSTIEGGVVNDFPDEGAVLTVSRSLIVGPCECIREACAPVSNGFNIESPGDTCGFDQPTDQVNVNADDLKLGPLEDNGGPTHTHALVAGSVAIDQILAEDCVDAGGEPLTTDQRGLPRPFGGKCDVGAFEYIPSGPSGGVGK